ncbi:hypothetical protein BLNAU_3774 [Blattamonas nauphoetae]|uniref:Uncharacterized protein n=1 Tax=Blattamonas nauphoetae TaxID=2049346 RepID=A0ABQ9YCC7_9EUKA|nr:hypothetical protein BLNAU_3774 [Blattamonas nauphoetae]
MAHIVRSERFNDPALVTTSAIVGPGAYTPELVSRQDKRSYVPFSVQSKRFSNTYSQTPGPGAYDYAEENEVYFKRKPLSSFASRTERFELTRKKADPGPGSYDLRSTWGKESFRNPEGATPVTKLDSSNPSTVTPPSIPTRNQSMGYQDGPYGHPQMKAVAKRGYTGRGVDAPGPGEYDVDAINHSRNFNRAGQYTFSQSARMKDRSNPNPGPGSYSPQRARERMHMTYPSTSFDSTTIREFVKPNDHPGPGSYNIRSTIQARVPEENVQSFGSCAIREISERNYVPLAQKRNPVPGPGEYNDPRVIRKPQKSATPFFSTSTRFSSSKRDIPGPGAYSQNIPSFKPRSTNSAGFGIRQSRFKNQKTDTVPGPGRYNPQGAEPSIVLRQHPSSVFMSRKSRFDDSSSLAPGPGAYETDVGGITVNATKTFTGDIHPSSSFCSTGRNTTKTSTNVPGPGSYSLGYPEYTKESGRGFLNTSPRFKDNKDDFPGPGSYLKSNADLAKHSFNRTIPE